MMKSIIEKEGANIDIGFNCRFLLESMQACETEYVRLSLSTPLMSMIIEPSVKNAEDDFIYLVLPVKMKD